MFDGQNIFHDSPSYSGGWYLHHAVHDLTAAGHTLRDAERLVHKLRGRGYDDTSLMWLADPYGKHSEHDWRKRAPSALEFLFSGKHGQYDGASRDDDPVPAGQAA